MKKIKYLICVISIFFVVEVLLKYLKPSPYVSDELLGWATKKNFRHTYNQTDLYGNSYISNYSTNSFGARNYQTEINHKHQENFFQILVIGDSFTMDPYSGNKKMWFSILADNLSHEFNLNVNVNAFGAGAYGTLQEYLAIEKEVKFKKNYKPNIILLQFCSNDFANNNLEIEKANFSISQYMRRPYYSNDQISYYDSFFSYFYRKNFLLKDSRLFAKFTFLLEILLRYIFSNNLNKINIDIINQTEKTTELLLKKIKNLYPNTPAFIFSCSNDQSNINKNWISIAEQSGFIVLKNSSSFIELASKKNKKIFYKDGGHLNNLGNNLWGIQIFEDLKTNKNLLNLIK